MKMSLSGKRLVPLLFIAALIFILLIYEHPLIAISEVKWLGLLLKFRDSAAPQKCRDIILVTIDRASVERYGRYPWGWDRYVQLIHSLSPTEEERRDGITGPRVLAFDIVFSYEDKKNGSAFAEAIRKFRNVVLAVGMDPESSSEKMIHLRGPVPAIKETKPPYFGSIVMFDSPEAAVVTLPTIVRGRYSQKDVVPTTIYAFEVCMLTLFRGASGDDIKLNQTNLKVKDDAIPFCSPSFVRLNNRLKSGNVRGNFFVSYRKTPAELFSCYHFSDVAEGSIPKERFNDRAVIVINTLDPNDRYKTATGNTIFGGELHAYALKTLLDRDYIDDPAPRVKLLILISLLALALIPLWRIKNRPAAFMTLLLILASYCALTIYLFMRFSLWLPLVYPVIMVIALSLGYMLLEQHATRKLLGSLLPSSFMKRLDPMQAAPAPGGTPTWATVLFADIRGYTNLSETLPSVEVMDLLNAYHELVKRPIHDNGGETFDYQGDAYMVVFGASGEMPDHAKRAVRAAIEISRLVEEHMRRCREEGKQSFEVGIGICTGEVAVGYVGHSERALPAAIGDPTNVAARLQGKSSELKTPVLLTESTFKELGEAFPTIALPPVQLKGKKEPLKIFTLDWARLEK